MTFRDASSCKVVKDFFAFAFNWTSNSDTNMIVSVIPSDCTVTIIFTFVCLFVETFMVFAFVLKFWESWWPAFFIRRKPLKSMITHVFALFKRFVVSLIAFASVKFFKSVAFSLLFVVNLVLLANRNTLFNSFIVLFVILAWNTFGKVLNIMSIFGTRFTLISKLIPQRSQIRARLTTAGFSIDDWLIHRAGFAYLIDWVPSGLIFGAHTDTWPTLVAGSDWGKTDAFVRILIELVSLLAGANSFSQRKNWTLGTGETGVIHLVGEGCFYRACRHVEFGCLCKHHQSILFLSNIAINPVWRLEVVLKKSVI